MAVDEMYILMINMQKLKTNKFLIKGLFDKEEKYILNNNF